MERHLKKNNPSYYGDRIDNDNFNPQSQDSINMKFS